MLNFGGKARSQCIIMEGKRLLEYIKDLKDVPTLPKAIRNYLNPLFQTTQSEDNDKYSTFALKATKACIKSLSLGKHTQTLLEVAMICMEAAVKNRERERSLNTERLLVILVSQCVKIREVEKSMRCCVLVTERLCKEQQEDAAMLLKNAADLIWSLAAQVEQRQDCDMPERVLRIRQQSLLTLLAAKPDISLFASRAIKTDNFFRKVKRENISSLVSLHNTLLSHEFIKKVFSTSLVCDDLGSIHMWLLQAAKSKSSRFANASSLLEKHLRCCCHKHTCELFLQELSWLSSQLPASPPPPESEWVSKLVKCSSFLPSVNRDLTSVQLPRIVESVDYFTTAIRTARKKWKEKEKIAFLPSSVFPPLKQLSTSYVKWMDRFMKTQLATLSKAGKKEGEGVICKVASCQLSCLSLANDALLDSLLDKNDEEEIELPRHNPLAASLRHPKALLAKECLPLIKQSHNILSSAPSPVRILEHRWVGTDAYNLGVTLHDEGLTEQAVGLLKLACEDLTLWCKHKGDTAYAEVKLTRKYCLLSDCYQMLHRYDDAIMAIANALASLPTNQIDYMKLLVSQYVRVKTSMVKSGHTDSVIMKRTIVDIPTEGAVFDDHIKTVFLEEELRHYKHQSRQPLPEAQLAVVNALLPLYSSCPNLQRNKARMLIELATLFNRVHNDVSASLRYVEQAIKMLQTVDVMCDGECVRLDQLAAAYLWKATFIHESKVRSCEGVDVLSDDDLPEVLTAAMLNEEVEESLQTAITCWEECVKMMDDHSLVPMKVLPSLLSSCHSLQLAFLLSSSLHLTVLSSKAANCLITITSSCSEMMTIHQWALSRQTWFCEETSDMAFSGLRDVVAKKASKGNAIVMHCHLALAYTLLLRGEMKRCCQLISGVLNDSLLSQRLQSSYSITAQAAMITSSYLQRQRPSVLPWEQYLEYLHSNVTSSSTTNTSFKLTELELLLEALKLLRSLAHSNATITTSSQQDESTEDEDCVCLDDAVIEEEKEKETGRVVVSYSLFSWEVMERLLQCLLDVGTLCVRQGAVRDGVHYYKEGLMLAQKMFLKYRCVEFMLLISEAKRLSGDTSAAQSLLLKASELLGLKSYLLFFLPDSDSSDENLLVKEISQLTLSPPPLLPHLLRKHHFLAISILHSCAQQLLSQYPSKASSILEHASTFLQSSTSPALSIQNAQLRAELLLSQQQPSQAMAVCERAATGFNSQQPIVDPLLRMRYAELYFTLGRAALMNVSLFRPNLSSSIWEGVGGMGEDQDEEEKEVILPKRVSRRCTRRLNLSSDDEAESRVKGRGRGRGKRTSQPKPEAKQKTTSITSSSLPVPPLLHPVLLNLLTSHQLCHPSCYFVLLREVSQLLTVCLASWDHIIASHFLLHSSHLTLTHQTILSLGRRIRNALTISFPSLILSSLTNDASIVDSVELCHSLQARNTLLLSTSHPPNLTCTQRLIDSLPNEWTFCQVVLVRGVVDSNHQCLVMVRVRCGRQPVIVRIPLKTPEKAIVDPQFSLDPLTQFDSLMSASLDTLKLTNKKEWWSSRRKLNVELKELLDNLEKTWFGPWRLLLQGVTEESTDSLTALLHRRGCTPVSDVWTEILANAVDMSREEIATVLSAVCKNKVPDKVTAEVMKLLSTCHDQSSTSRGPLLLCLGAQLQSLPLESQPCLIKQPTSRVPSLLFLASLIALQSPSHSSSSISIDTSRTFYVLNPKGDLINTEKMFKTWFDTERGWKGVVSREPTTNEISRALKDHHMFIYCGHGSGREFLPSNRLQQLSCLAAVIQMGCSSGKLSINGSLDPTGYAMNYLIAGCPCIVGNLWDVTDQDIDRYCKTLLKSWLHQNPPGTLLQLTACSSREICTLPYLIGASPVVYGLPTTRHL